MQSMMRWAFAAGALALAGSAVAKDETTLGISLEASTLGAGLSLGMPVGERFNLRGVYHGYTYDIDEVEDDSGATYDGELDLKSAGLMLDFHPFKGAFRITAGLASNGNEITLTGVPTGGTFEVGDCTYESDPTPGNELAVDGTVEFASTAPYVGLGWGGNMNSEPGFFMTFDVGVLLSGSPDTSLSGRGGVRAQAGQGGLCGNELTYEDASTYQPFLDEVEKAEDEVNDETKDYELWPNIALGIGWRF
jgi:hypothetical protein